MTCAFVAPDGIPLSLFATVCEVDGEACPELRHRLANATAAGERCNVGVGWRVDEEHRHVDLQPYEQRSQLFG